MRRLHGVLVGLFMLPAIALARPAQAPGGLISFRVRHLGVSWVMGTFREWAANVEYDPEQPELASVTAWIHARSLDTGHPRRDADVRRHYLAVDSFPAIVFTSTKVERAGLERLRVTGDLTINAVTRPVVLDTEVRDLAHTPQGRRRAFIATTTIYRQDFGIIQNTLLERVPIVGDEVEITIEMEALGK